MARAAAQPARPIAPRGMATASTRIRTPAVPTSRVPASPSASSSDPPAPPVAPGLSELGEGPVQAAARVRRRDAEDAPDLGVREIARELERQQVALAAVKGRQRRPQQDSPERQLDVLVGR